jgi:hypothetical protein
MALSGAQTALFVVAALPHSWFHRYWHHRAQDKAERSWYAPQIELVA